MDRRYSQSRFYDGTRARNTDRGEALSRRYLERARRINNSAQTYGGSAPRGGQSSTPQQGLAMLLERAQSSRDQRRVFDQVGSGSLGARAEIKRSRLLEDAGGGVA